MALTAKVTVDSTGIVLSGAGIMKDDLTLKQDGGRATALAPYTVLAKEASSGKYVPLEDVDPAVIPASLACGAIGGTLPEFAALSSASFKIGFDGEAVIEVVCDFSGIDTVEDTPGYFTCGANGSAIGAGWDALTDAELSIAVDGAATVDITGMDFTDATEFGQIAEIINNALVGLATCTYDYDGDYFRFISNSEGETSSVVLTAVSGGAGTDITAAGFLNVAGGSATAGTGGENLGQSIVDIINAELAGRGECSFDGDKFIFWSNSTEYGSAVSYLTAGTTGTDISGASYLNGLTGTGVLTAATTADGENVPAGIYWGSSVTAAALVADDVENRKILVGGDLLVLDEDKVVLENSLDLDDVITSTGQTIREALEKMGIYTRDNYINGQVAPV